VPVRMKLKGSQEAAEGILLDFSEDGMDVLAAQPLYPSAVLSVRFAPPDLPSELEITGEVAWANPNGESGICFRDIPHSVREALRRWLQEHTKPIEPEQILPTPGCKLTDLSLGGCYMETPSPFPERTRVQLLLRANGTELQAEGLVRVMHPSHGMGIEFSAYSAEHLQQTEAFIEFLVSRPGVEPELLVSPRAESGNEHKISLRSGEFEDPLLELLRNHESLSQKMFLQALEKQRSASLAQSR
jgi:hypothetical protein